MSLAAHRRVFAALVAVMVLLHVDVWNHGRTEPLVLGWLPWDLAYHLGWMALGTGLVFYMTSGALWPDDGDA